MSMPLDDDSSVRATASELATYRATVREWVTARLSVSQGPPRGDIEFFTPDVMAQSRVLQRALFDGGFAGITWPREYGGQGLSAAHEEIFFDEAQGYDLPNFGLLGDTTFATCVPTMITHAPPEFLTRFVPQVLRGEALVCQFFSEPEAGSDLAAARTRATRDGDDWVIDGQKIWSSWAHLADWGMCLARTDWGAPKHRGLTWFAVPCTSPGLTIKPIEQITGEADFCEEFFDHVVVPDSSRVSAINDGWNAAQTMLFFERGAGRTRDAGTLEAPGPLAPDLVELARDRGTLGDVAVRQKLARAHTNDFIARALWYRIGQLARNGQSNPGVAAYGKLFMGTYEPLRAQLATEIGGPGALTWEEGSTDGRHVALDYLGGRRLSIAGGTNEMQRNAIAEQALGMPREKNPTVAMPFREVVGTAAESENS
jgi:alkylation response protein AidB-like acyl-CoA dehydrogenase